ncbi:hypothetical protein [Paenibacillus rhizophilus]|uniref:Uncharacterized protein n=1 Tax=Paenibacillus rhizophilus TaxID=1850366 RepID=A0A3N9P6N6_9BACL|nr:hypothetical protein [Paenibacillus rhizophilus]RQW11858.1 hypothetical protein EH198_09285 [Paenibacillus rhizophilus]
MRIFESLDRFASLISENFNSFMKDFPLESQAAEAVHQGMYSLTNDSEYINESISTGVTATLVFGAHSSWINAFNMTVSGHIDTGFSELRRAVEFTCYAAKIKGSDKRAEDWMKQRSDPQAMRRFSGQFRIPTAYTNEKFKYLRPLLVTYDMANYYGAHGNLETMAGKIHTTDGLRFSYQADREIIYLVAPSCILSGYRILQSLDAILDNLVIRPQNFKSTKEYIEKSIRELRLDLANYRYQGRIPEDIRRFICMDDDTETNKMFDEMIEKERLRMEKRKPSDLEMDYYI